MSEPVTESLTYAVEMTAVEELQGVPAAANSTLQHDGFNLGPTRLTSSTTPPITRTSPTTQTMTGAAVTIDLTALPSSQDDINGTGKKVNLFHVRNRGANAITIAPGASNGYELFGAGKDFVLPAGGELTLKFNDNLADIDATHKNIELTGTAADQCDLLIGLG